MRQSAERLADDGVLSVVIPDLRAEPNRKSLRSSLDDRTDFRMRYFVPEAIRELVDMAGLEAVSVRAEETELRVVATPA